MTMLDKDSVSGIAPTAAYDPTKKQKSADKTSRIPIKIIPILEVLKSQIGLGSRPARVILGFLKLKPYYEKIN